MSERNYDEWDEGLEIDFRKIYESLKKGIKWVIVTPLIFTILMIIYVLFIAKPIFTSQANILLVGSNNSQSSLIGLASQFGFSLPSNNNGETYLSVETLPEILKSRSLTNSILFSEFIVSDEEEPESLLSILFESSETDELDSNKLIAIGHKYVSEHVLEAKQIKNTAIFSMYFNSHDPYLSAQIGSQVISELQRMQLDFNKSELSNQKEFVTGRLEEVYNELYIAETSLKSFRERNLQINLSPSLLLDQERLEREIDIQTEIYISLKQQLEQIKINENKSISSVKIIDEPNIPITFSKPNRKLLVIIAGFMGLLLGSMIAVIKEN